MFSIPDRSDGRVRVFLQKPVVLVGNSLGGYSSLLAAAAGMTTVGGIAGLVLVNSAGPLVEEGKQVPSILHFRVLEFTNTESTIPKFTIRSLQFRSLQYGVYKYGVYNSGFWSLQIPEFIFFFYTFGFWNFTVTGSGV